MEAKTNFQLIYDTDCPLCKWYSGLFVKYNFLRSQERISYSLAVENPMMQFDEDLARNKIALLDLENEKVHYGIDSLLKVLGLKLKWIETIGKLPVIYQFLTLFYAFISFNRKAFAPTACNNACYPGRSVLWRGILIVLSGLYVNYVTWSYFNTHLNHYFISGFYFLDLVFYSSQFVFQFVIFKLLKQHNFYDYAGQIAVVSLLGGITLQLADTGLNLLSSFGIEIGMLEPFCYGMVYLFMLIQHKNRIKILGITQWMSISWIIFRFLIYPLAFQFYK